MTELCALISWEGNSIKNIFLNTYSVPSIMKGPKGKTDKIVPVLDELSV